MVEIHLCWKNIANLDRFNRSWNAVSCSVVSCCSELLSAEIIAEKTNITAGDNLQLQCQVKDENTKGVNVTWSFNGRPLTQSETRYKVKALELVVESTKTSDGGEYGCTVTRGHDQATSSVIINVHGMSFTLICRILF